jgi:type I restriction enzyme R subunit
LSAPSYIEDTSSKVPALQLFIKLGYNYLNLADAFIARGKKSNNVILEDILSAQLSKINKINYRGVDLLYTEANIQSAIESIKDFNLTEGLIKANEKIYDQLIYGKALEQSIEGDKKSFTLKYIDWENPSNNIFHVTEEFEVRREGSDKHYTPDLVLFVNGIPLCVIECKPSSLKDPLEEAISQHLRNQQPDGIRKLYIYSQLLLALSINDGRYATTGSKERYWLKWEELFSGKDEESLWKENLSKIKNEPLSDQVSEALFYDRSSRKHFEDLHKEEIKITGQDKLIYSLCKPERMLDLIYKFIVFDAGEKKIARYQQYFVVKNAVKRLSVTESGSRNGGVVWHTQGSGKSLSMIMLAKSLALDMIHFKNPRIVLVTDRVDLDDQIYNTFKSCGLKVSAAVSGEDLGKLLEDENKNIIATTIHKFDALMAKRKFVNPSSQIIILVDEAHRTQYGIANAKMNKALPNAGYVGFTGTPIVKELKNTIYKFGGLIEPVYNIQKAVDDKAVVPLLYEGRHVIQNVNEQPIDTYFELISKGLNENLKADLKKKYSSADHLNEAEQKIYRIAWDVSMHYSTGWKGTGFKGQFVTPSKRAALMYKKFMDEIDLVSTEVLISAPDDREGNYDINEGDVTEVQQFWKNMMQRFGTQKAYDKALINAFKFGEEPEIIIVVDKLLTGFDAPRNTILYLAKKIQDYSLLQAIARVNRVFEGKDHGFVIDYYGVLGELDEALTKYSELAQFDEEDLAGAIENINIEIEKLPQFHSMVWELFKEIKNKNDIEAFEQLLSDEEIRVKFYNRVSQYSRTLKVALSTFKFHQSTDERIINMYRADAAFFLKLRASVQKRYSDRIEYKNYERQIQKLIDTHITSDKIVPITELVNIFEADKFEQEVEKIQGTAAKADTIASRTQKTISEKIKEDPVFYERFSQMLKKAIEDFRNKRISDAEYLDVVMKIKNSILTRTGDDTPEMLEGKETAKAFYGIYNNAIQSDGDQSKNVKAISAKAGIKIDEIFRDNIIIGWKENPAIQKKIEQKIEDFLFEFKVNDGYKLDFEKMDEIINKSMEVAKNRYDG